MPKLGDGDGRGAGRDLLDAMVGGDDDAHLSGDHIRLDATVIPFNRAASQAAPKATTEDTPKRKAGYIGTYELPEPQPLSQFIRDGLSATEPDWLIKGLIPHNGITLMSGQQKLAMKTYTAIQFAVCVATGRSCKSIETMQRGRVLGLFEEGRHKKLAERWAAVCDTLKVDWERGEADDFHMLYRPLFKLDSKECRKQLLDACESFRPALVILDPFFRMMDGDENKQEDVNHAMDTVFGLQQLGCAPLFLAHLTGGVNPKQDIDQQVRGSSLITNSYDVHIALRRYKEKEKFVSYYVRSRDAEPVEGIVKWDIRTEAPEDPERPTYAQCVFVEGQGD